MRGSSGSIIGASKIPRDITKRKEGPAQARGERATSARSVGCDSGGDVHDRRAGQDHLVQLGSRLTRRTKADDRQRRAIHDVVTSGFSCRCARRAQSGCAAGLKIWQMKRIDRNAGDDRVDARVTDVACTALLSYRPTQPRGEAVHLKLFPEKPSLPFRRVVRSIRVSGLHRTRSESARPIVSDRAAAGARRRCVQPRARLWSAPPVQRFWFRGDSIDLGL